MQKIIFMGLMVLPFNLYVYSLIFSGTGNLLSILPSHSIAYAQFSSHHHLMGDEVASRDEQQPGRECIRIGGCKV